MNEITLVDKVKSGDAAAIQQLYSDNLPFVRSIIAKYDNRWDVSTVAHDVLTKVIQNIDKYRPTYKFKTWLYTVVYNYCHDISRNRKLRHESYNIEDVEFVRGTSFVDPLETQDLQKLISKHKNTLPPRLQRYLELRFEDELTYEEIKARMSDSNLNNTKVNIHRARKIFIQSITSDPTALSYIDRFPSPSNKHCYE